MEAYWAKNNRFILFRVIGARKEESPSKLSHRVRFEKWRTNGVMNFEKEDADRSLWKRVIHQRVLVRVLVQKKNAEVADVDDEVDEDVTNTPPLRRSKHGRNDLCKLCKLCI